eukprot:CAMPEP_0168621598 /NCGR_PEP_ID=MMETSP0449_2-20121227/7786_1 /TAXON_ID=1082188 /ORGANISM="Strombidium rassoulzadegani, Strain ras09" /LENGTH=101 /DNA_ID=CAMNT_0008662741 /DNA_START=453 /DNA_END=758 /DNA_ORIENTATION=+
MVEGVGDPDPEATSVGEKVYEGLAEGDEPSRDAEEEEQLGQDLEKVDQDHGLGHLLGYPLFEAKDFLASEVEVELLHQVLVDLHPELVHHQQHEDRTGEDH